MDRGGKDKKTFFYANLAVDATTGASLGISVHRGHFSGNTFTWDDVHTVDSPANLLVPDSDFYDKEAIAVDTRGKGDGYVSLTNFQELCGNPQFGFGQIEVWRTHDSGNTWQGPAIAGPEAPDSVADCGFSGTLQQSSAPAIGPKGEVYVVWQFGPFFAADGSTSTDADIVVARSLDGGVTFDPPVKVADINSMRQNPPVGYNRSRINDHPRIAVVQSGEHKGRVYVVFYSAISPVGAAPVITCPTGISGVCIAQSLVSSQVFISFSDNKGLTWSTPSPVGPAVPATGVKRLWPVVTVNGDEVNVVYYESLETQNTPAPTDTECNIALGGGLRRVGVVSSLVNTFLARAEGDDLEFDAPVLVSSATSNWCTAIANIRPNFGDYIGSINSGDDVLAAWADSRNGPVDTFFARVEP
jgi:hypothetical protein